MIKVSKNKNVRVAVLGLIILYTILIVPLLTLKQLKFMENNIVRLVLIVLISLVCLWISSFTYIRLFLVISLNRLNNLKSKDEETNNVEAPTESAIESNNTEEEINNNINKMNDNLKNNSR